MGEKPVELSFLCGHSSGISMSELVHYNNDTYFTQNETSFLLNSLLSPHQQSTSSHNNYTFAQPVTFSNNSNDFSPILPKPTPLYPTEIFNASIQLVVNACMTLSNHVNIQQNDNCVDNLMPTDIIKPISLQANPNEANPSPNEISENCSESLNNLLLRNESVIQNSSSAQPISSLLPTCEQPKICTNFLLTKNEEQLQGACTRFSPTWSQPSSSTLSASSSVNESTKIAKNNSNNRLSYPREFKLMVIERYLSNGRNKYRTCKEFQITKSMLNGWLQKAEKIRNSRPGSLKSGRSGRRPLFPGIEKQLFQLYSERQKLLGTQQNNANNNNNSTNNNRSSSNSCSRTKRGKISNRWLRETAKQLARQQCSEQELLGMCQFSERWLTNFKKRYLISAKQISS